ncbi:serine hydrolase domain-containing protein [Pseudactinotalea sp. Z1739]|uniref:serine hydrolase domain-containing protein n=1 Tax=Pseudactinotalea sp. Z1739 TaxID=3413028 RepID=UPI003C7AA427
MRKAGRERLIRSPDSRRRPAGAILVAVAAVAAALASLASPTSAGAQSISPEIDAYLQDQVDRSPLPGLAVAVTQGEDVLHLGGYGTAGGGRPMTADTPMRVASLSKAFTAVAVLQQVERDAVDLDEPVRRYLPDFTLVDDSAAGRITVRHLLHHTSGLSDPGFPGLWRLDQHSPAERLAELASARPSTGPGEEFDYFNRNYDVLARLVEVASGEEFDSYLQREIFTPLGMVDTVSLTRAEDAVSATPSLAQGHVALFGAAVPRAEPEGYVAGSAGIVTTAADLARWLPVHGNAGAAHGQRVLGADSLRLSHRPPAHVDSTYAMGWVITTFGAHPALEHTGVAMTFHAEQVLLPETGHGLVLLANANHAFGDVTRIKEGLVALLVGEPPPTHLMTHWRLIGLVAVGMTIGLLLRVRSIRRRDRWAHRRVRGPRWLRWLGVLRLLTPALLLAALPLLISGASGRVFPMRLLVPVTPEVVAWLTVATGTGIALAVARVAALKRARRTNEAGGEASPDAGSLRRFPRCAGWPGPIRVAWPRHRRS